MPSPSMTQRFGKRTRTKTKAATLCGVICVVAFPCSSDIRCHSIPLPLRWRLLPCAPSCSFCGRVLCPLCLFDVHVPRLSCTLCVDVAGRRAVAWRRRPLRCPPCQWPVRPRPGMSGGRMSRVFVCPVMTDVFCSPWCTSRLRDRLQVKWPPRVCVQLVLGSSGSGVSGTSVGRVLPQFGSRQKRLHGCVAKS